IPCLEVRRDDTSMEFRGLWTSVALIKFPIEIEVLVALGFWGSPGTGDFVVRIERDGQSAELYREPITVPYPIQVVDVAIPLQLSIPAPGPAFLECYFDDQLLGRRAVYFGQLAPDIDLRNPPAVETATLKVQSD